MILAQVYVLSGQSGGVLKVGHSRNPERRRRQLGSHLQLVHSGAPCVDAARIENLAQRLLKLAGKHVGGEAFRASLAEVTAAIARAERIACGTEQPPPDLPRSLNRSKVVRSCRKRGAWRFTPSVLDRLQRFVERQELPTTQTAVIEAALTDYLDRKESKRSATR